MNQAVAVLPYYPMIMPHWAVSMKAYVATVFQLTSTEAEREIANQKFLGKPWLLCVSTIA